VPSEVYINGTETCLFTLGLNLAKLRSCCYPAATSQCQSRFMQDWDLVVSSLEQVTVGRLASDFNSNLFYTHPLAKTIGFRRSKTCPGHLVRERGCEIVVPLGNNRAEERGQFV